ncbi:MAG TPA: Na(+)-translocating NADH-quinone reductase subunit A [Bacteroidetes bacterium]|nr:Na(+)-translocating NADH-quinone reductase subunit A [Bacteroidota bacterium]
MAGFSIFPSVNELVSPGKRGFSGGEKVTVLKKGFDIKLEGAAPGNIDGSASANTFAMQPPNFRGIAPIPKVVVEIGDNVKAGDHLFFNKKTPDVKYVAPVSGEVVAINRGDRRSITEIVILADKQQQYRQLPAFDLGKSSREELANYLFDTGGWTLLRSRPFDTVAGMHDVPRDIFISTFDTAPLAPNLDIVVEGQGEAFQKGLDVLAKLTPGQVHLGLNAGGKKAPSPVFAEAKNVQKHWFSGKHPAGNVGIQIHHIAPITPSCTVWTLGVQEVIVLGKIFTEGRWNTERVVALTGAELDEPKYVRTLAGANVGELLKGNLSGDNVRLISGDVLSGQKKSAANFLNFFDDQLTVIEEGNYYEMFGWLLPSKPVPTVSKSIPSAALFPNTLYKGDTNMHGEKRAFVMTGEYESVLPMDIYPQHLMKAVLTNDYEKMEGLGIHELVEEDIALCEFVCTSKQPLQKILRTGLDMMNEQG